MQLSIQQRAIESRSLALLVLVIAAVLLVLLSAPSVEVADNTCLTEADVVRAADRSRNGIPTSCTVEVLNRRVVE